MKINSTAPFLCMVTLFFSSLLPANSSAASCEGTVYVGWTAPPPYPPPAICSEVAIMENCSPNMGNGRWTNEGEDWFRLTLYPAWCFRGSWTGGGGFSGLLACGDSVPHFYEPDELNDSACADTPCENELIEWANLCGGSEYVVDWDWPTCSGNCDECPDDPDKIAPGICGCGVPDTDSDGGGTPDCIDGCPDDPSTTDPAECFSQEKNLGPGDPNC